MKANESKSANRVEPEILPEISGALTDNSRVGVIVYNEKQYVRWANKIVKEWLQLKAELTC